MTASNFAPLADAYASLKAQADDYKTRAEAVRKQILETGADFIEGDIYTVVVDTKKGSRSLDKNAVLALLSALGASQDQVDALYTEAAPTKALRIKASLAAAA